MCRIKLTDNTMDALMKMSDGNPGALTAMMVILDKHDNIDPQAMLGGIGALMSLDTLKIYGTDIYVLFNDKCGGDVRKMLMIMRAVQLGFFQESKLREMAADQSREVDLPDSEWLELDAKVCEQLEDFAKAA